MAQKNEKTQPSAEKAKKETNQTQDTPQAAQASPLTINAQYIKDLSFEHPNPSKTLKPSNIQPEIDINIDVNAEKLQEHMYEVTLSIKANAKREKDVMFISEIIYAGIFTLSDAVPKDAVHPILMIECPRMLFPFARSILANTTREGGFPPLSLNPIDFASLYKQQMQAAQNKKQA